MHDMDAKREDGMLLVHPRPRTRRRRTPLSVLPALCRVVMHVAVKYPDVFETHAEDLQVIEAWLSGGESDGTS